MNIGLTQRILHYNDIAYDCIEHGWYNLLRDHTLFYIPNDIKYDINGLIDTLDMVIFTGGNHDLKRHTIEVKILTRCYLKNIPILGVCHGAFFLNYMEDGINEDIEGHHNTEHSIVLEGKEYTVNSHHTNSIKHLANAFEPKAIAQDGSIEAFRHKSKCIWGLNWHPERMKNPVLPKEIKEKLNI
jgi:putative glutamine amidotransferase